MPISSIKIRDLEQPAALLVHLLAAPHPLATIFNNIMYRLHLPSFAIIISKTSSIRPDAAAAKELFSFKLWLYQILLHNRFDHKGSTLPHRILALAMIWLPDLEFQSRKTYAGQSAQQLPGESQLAWEHMYNAHCNLSPCKVLMT